MATESEFLVMSPDDLLGAPMVPERSWFESIPEDWDPINEDHSVIWLATSGSDVGRFAGLVAPDGACILDGREKKGRCFTVPAEPGSYDFAHLGDCEVSDGGDPIRVGRLAAALNHAAVDVAYSVAADVYAHTGQGIARVRYLHDPVRGGLFAVGALDPTVTVWDSLMVRASALSGDWRWIEDLGGYRLAASQVVNVPGYRPTPVRAGLTLRSIRASVTATAGGVVTGWVAADDSVSPDVSRETSGVEDLNEGGDLSPEPKGADQMGCTCNNNTQPAVVDAAVGRRRALATLAAMKLVDAPVWQYGTEAVDADGAAWYVTDSGLVKLDDGTDGVLVTGSLQELDSYPRLVTALPVSSLTQTGKIAQWEPDLMDADAVAAAAGDTTTGTDSAANAEAITALLARVDTLESIVAGLMVDGVTAVDLVSAGE